MKDFDSLKKLSIDHMLMSSFSTNVFHKPVQSPNRKDCSLCLTDTENQPIQRIFPVRTACTDELQLTGAALLLLSAVRVLISPAQPPDTLQATSQAVAHDISGTAIWKFPSRLFCDTVKMTGTVSKKEFAVCVFLNSPSNIN